MATSGSMTTGTGSKPRKNDPDQRQPKAGLRRQLEMYELIFDCIYNGIMVTDADGYVTHFNKPYGQFLDLEPAQQIGRHCTEVIENTRMHLVAQTGQAEINQSHLIKGQNMVVQRIPIWENEKVIGVFGQVMFKDVKDVGKLAKELSLLESKVKLYEEELITLRSTRYTFDSIAGKSQIHANLKQEALRASTNHFPVLITGESGTGKELFAQAIHHASARRVNPFVRINCAAIPRDLLESELFGYEKGAFTGARKSGKPGKFELARRGTVFLDEIGDLPLEMQPKLLRVIEDKEFERVGGTKLIQSDFRIIAATNRNLDDMINAGDFRKDLFYRLSVIPLKIPPLRERKSDIVPVARFLLDQMAQDANLPAIKIDRDVDKAFRKYGWPGNVRELSNVLERAMSAIDGDTICLQDLPFYLQRSSKGASDGNQSSLKDVQARTEKEAIRYALKESKNNKASAARVLGIHRTLLYKKMKKYNLPL